MKILLAFTAGACAVLIACGPDAESKNRVPFFDGASAFAHLTKQCAFGPRIPGSEGHGRCLEYLVRELSGPSAKAARQTFNGVLPLTGRNVAFTNVTVSFAPKLADRVLFCAHWDTRARADLDPSAANRNRAVPGANDGASGTAVLLEAARTLHSRAPAVGVDIVLFDGEDNGIEGDWDSWCLGSRHYAQSLTRWKHPRYAVLLDMVGDRDLHLPVERHSRRYAPEAVDRVWGLARRLGLPAFDPSDGYEVVDDHLELIKVGIPAVDIIDLDYAYWHTVSDTPEKCSPESLAQTGTLLLNLAYDPPR